MPASGEIANNPLNIRIGNDWGGEVAWERMTEAQREWGIRAAVKLLDAYRRRHGLTTIAGIINRWAPPSENDTAAYISRVASSVGVSPHAEIDTTDPQILLPLLEAMISVEIGRQPYPEHVLWHGIRLADKKEKPMRKQTAHKAHVSALVTFVAVLAAMWGGGEMPPLAELESAIRDVAVAGGSALASWLVTYFKRNREKPE